MNEIPKDCKGALIARGGGADLPWGEQITPEAPKVWQLELFKVVDELARLERWPDDDYDIVIGAIERQPISTLRPDLWYFRERLDAARAMSPRSQCSKRPGEAK